MPTETINVVCETLQLSMDAHKEYTSMPLPRKESFSQSTTRAMNLYQHITRGSLLKLTV